MVRLRLNRCYVILSYDSFILSFFFFSFCFLFFLQFLPYLFCDLLRAVTVWALLICFNIKFNYLESRMIKDYSAGFIRFFFRKEEPIKQVRYH